MANESTSPQKVLAYIKQSGELIAAAQKQAKEASDKQTAVQALIPDAVESLVKNGHIDESLRDKAAASLSDHAKTLEILASVAAPNAEQLSRIGTASNVKTASSRYGINGPFIGARNSESNKESNDLLMQMVLGRS